MMLKNLIDLIKDMLDPDTYEDGMCGIPGFHTLIGDPFYDCCVEHDKAYETVPPGKSTKEIDNKLYNCCLYVADQYPSIYDVDKDGVEDSFIEVLSEHSYQVVNGVFNEYLTSIWHTREVLTLRAKIYYKLARRYGVAREWLGKLGLRQLGTYFKHDKNESN